MCELRAGLFFASEASTETADENAQAGFAAAFQRLQHPRRFRPCISTATRIIFR